jgi:hypothetical protein
MNEVFTESFEQFSSRATPFDLMLYAGAALVLYVLFKDQLSPVQKVVLSVVEKVKGLLNTKSNTDQTDTFKTLVDLPSVKPQVIIEQSADSLFFDLVESWKRTRDLAVKSNCSEAVKVADQMFPFLSPNSCKKEEKTS